MPDDFSKVGSNEELARILSALEARISRIEQELKLEPMPQDVLAAEGKPIPAADTRTDSLELRIGLYWFAKVGIVALIIGVAFLILRPFIGLNPIFAPALGYLLAGGVAIFSRFVKKSAPLLAGYLLGGGMVLFYLATLRLHYFSSQKVIDAQSIEAVLLLAITCASIVISAKRKSVYLVAVSLTMGFATALMSDQLPAYSGVTLIIAGIAVYFSARFEWPKLLIFSVIIGYLSNLIWFLNNPIIGNPLSLREVPYPFVFLVLVFAMMFAAGNFFRRNKEREDVTVILSALLNSAFGIGLFFLVTVARFQNHLAMYHLAASCVFLALAFVSWSREQGRFQTFFYAMTAYAALSVAIIGGFKPPDFFILLCWQSLLVVSTAVWFRSKFIVVANFVIYSLIFVAYLVLAGAVDATSLSFGVVALLSARVLSWQRSRLDLKTDKMRTAYLAAAFVIFPYALYHIVPTDFVTLSWLAIAIVYYVISVILKNAKYRWMALLTFLLTAVYLIIIGIIKLEPVLRIISFLILGVALLAISFAYARARMKAGQRDS